MKLQTKLYLGIIIIFAMLAVVIAVLSINYVNTNTIREAASRVRIYARAGWEIHNARVELIRSALEVLAQKPSLRDLLRDPGNGGLASAVREDLEAIRREQKMDILNLTAPDGTVVLRTRFPYNRGDDLATDPIVRQVISTHQASAGVIILELDRLDVEGPGLIERCLAIDKEPRGMLAGAAVPVLENGQLLGVVQMGSLLNGSVEEVDRIRDAVFANEYHNGKPVGTATLFMKDLRISTNVLDNQGRRAVGTRVSREVAEQVLEQGLSWTGRAFVVDTWYLAQYDPITDPAGNVIGMLYVGELEQKYLDLRTRSVIMYLSVILAGMVLAFAMSYLVTKGILGPIRTLSEATRRISGGALAHRVPVKSKDEVGDLSASFNHMAEQLERQREEIERSQQELQVLNSELKATNRNYMELLGFVSHELKNPLTSAVMSLHTVKDGYLGEVTPAQRKSLESAACSLDYFQDMIRNYLDLSRLETGEVEVRKAPVSLLADVVQPVLEGFQRQLQAQNMVVDNRILRNVILNADGDLTRIVYSNLLSNAVKYGYAGGTIVLDAQEDGHKVTLSVRNDGAGIPREKMGMLFKKFSRLDGPHCAGKRGTGLGLYICKQIVDKQGGDIWADSRVGEWVEFSFALPK
jgi:two-component system NtrC family sensor kinase